MSWQAPCVRDWSGILLERSGKRYSGKPDGLPERPRKCQRTTVNRLRC
ncbi:MAG: hypothetical protein IJZ87_03615 [Bacteroidales bacterium]|nr:hypothetical protein [Bacteroidales bacterium]